MSQSLFQQMVFCNMLEFEDKKELKKKSQSLFQQMVFCNRKSKSDAIIVYESQSLFQQMVFCNIDERLYLYHKDGSQSLFQQMVFCNECMERMEYFIWFVTILILVDGFLQQQVLFVLRQTMQCHNLYFSRWFSAITVTRKEDKDIKTSQSLFQQMVFCNIMKVKMMVYKQVSQSLFQQMVFCNL